MSGPSTGQDPPRIGVLALQGNVREHVVALESAGAQAVPVRRPAELANVEGLVLPGGESTTIDKLLRIFGLRDPLIARMAEGLPVLGSCAGMILLADSVEDGPDDQQTLGGIDMVVRRNAFGRQVDSFEQDLSLSGIADPERAFRGVFIRAPWVEKVGPSVEVLGSLMTGDGRPHAVAVRQRGLVATAFHPELTSDVRVHRWFVDLVAETALG